MGRATRREMLVAASRRFVERLRVCRYLPSSSSFSSSVCNRYSMRPSVLWNIQARARGRNPEGELPCILQGFLMLYVFYITTTPYLPCNNKNINRKELYDFYYTAITLTTGYKKFYKLYLFVSPSGRIYKPWKRTLSTYCTHKMPTEIVLY